MKKLTFILATLLMVSSSTFGQKSDLSGEWKLNNEKSELAEQYSMAPNEIALTINENKLKEVRHISFQGEDIEISDSYTLDGKECENPGWMDTVKKSTANWSDDGSVLTIVTKLPMQDEDMIVTREFKIKGEVLVIKSVASSSYGEVTEMQLFERL